MAFPPVPVYPRRLDDDHSLFLVYNTTEALLCQDNTPWADEVVILPVAPGAPEIWAGNGFATVGGEMFYYESVSLNADGRVYKLRDCARNLGGTPTRFNPKGTWVRGFVVAEHHNQILSAIIQVEEFVGSTLTPNQATLDWRIRHLQNLPIIFDDFQCPDIDFTFLVVDNDPQTGILATYQVVVDPPGALNNFRIDFGDGEFTTTTLAGTHRYALTATIDPVVTIGNDKCQVVLTPVARENPTEPPPAVSDVFDIPVPVLPQFPDFTFVPCTVPEPDIALPSIVLPCISLEGQLGFPSVIIGPDFNIPSQVTFTGIDHPIIITQSEVRFIGDVNIPSIVFFDIPPTIVIEPPIPPTIVIIASTASTVVGLDWSAMPDLKVDWGDTPSMNVNLQFPKQVKMQSAADQFGGEFHDLFDGTEHVRVEYETMGLPSEIKIVPPVMPAIRVDSSDIPRRIQLDVTEVDFPAIAVDASRVPRTIELVGKGGESIPTTIEIVGHEIPSAIELLSKFRIPEKIYVELSSPIPDRILVESDLRVTGIPEYLEIRGFPDFIPVKFPDAIPPVELVYSGAPIELKITMDEMLRPSADGAGPCVMLVPCSR